MLSDIANFDLKESNDRPFPESQNGDWQRFLSARHPLIGLKCAFHFFLHLENAFSVSLSWS